MPEMKYVGNAMKRYQQYSRGWVQLLNLSSVCVDKSKLLTTFFSYI
jgi:hypothetical protein